MSFGTGETQWHVEVSVSSAFNESGLNYIVTNEMVDLVAPYSFLVGSFNYYTVVRKSDR